MFQKIPLPPINAFGVPKREDRHVINIKAFDPRDKECRHCEKPMDTPELKSIHREFCYKK